MHPELDQSSVNTDADEEVSSSPLPPQSSVLWTRRRQTALFGVVALIIAFSVVYGFVSAPGYTDVFYHFNAAERLVTGQGLTDAYLWTYIGAPDTLPAPSHLYWMPLTSIIAAFGMWITQNTTYAAAQLPFALMLAATGIIGFRLGWRITGKRRGAALTAWIAGLLTLLSGFFTRYWGAIDTFAPYALIGAAAIYVMGSALTTRQARELWMVAGALAAFAHLTRADGVLLLGVGVVIALWRMIERRRALHRRVVYLFLMLLLYLLVMSPWFLRNQFEVGSPLPLGGSQAIWFSSYDDLFNYPPDASPDTLGLEGFINSRREAFVNNAATFIAVEGLIAMTPFMLIGLWRRRKDPFLRPFWLYALLLHAVMTFVFPYPGYRGGLFHSAAALIPFWAALGVVGIDDAVKWIASRRRTWQPETAKRVFSGALLLLALILSLQTGLAGRVTGGTPPLYTELNAVLPPDAVVMINDPAALYHYTGLGGVVIPNEDIEAIRTIARKYHVDYLLLESGGMPAGIAPLFDTPSPYLLPLPISDPNVRLYAITP